MKKMIISENKIRSLVKECLTVTLLTEVYYRFHLNENSYAEAVDFNKVASLEKQLLGYAYTLTKNTEDAKDLTQNTIMRAYEKSDHYREDSNLMGWLKTIMSNLYKNDKMSKSHRMMSYVPDITSYEGHASNYNSEYYTDRSDDETKVSSMIKLTNRVNDAINAYAKRYGELHKKVFYKLVDGVPAQKIADEFGLTVDQVRHYGRNIRTYLKRKGLSSELYKIIGS